MQKTTFEKLYSVKLSKPMYFNNIKCLEQDKEDIIQNAIIKLIRLQSSEKIEKISHIFNKMIRQCKIDYYRRGSVKNKNGEIEKFIEFSSAKADIAQHYLLSKSEIAKQKETIDYIVSKLSKSQKKLFLQYFVQGYTVRELEKKHNMSKSDISRKLKKIKNKIHKLKITELYDHRYLQSYGDKGINYPVFVPERTCKDTGKQIDIKDYKEQQRVNLQTNDIEFAKRLNNNCTAVALKPEISAM